MNKHNPNGIPHTTPRQSATFTQDVNSDIRRAAATEFMISVAVVLNEKFHRLTTCCLWGRPSQDTP